MAQTTQSRNGPGGFTRAPDDPRPPAALVVGIAFTAQLGWLGLALTAGLPSAATTVGVVVVAVVASWWLVVPASLSMALISFLAVDGFAENRLGQLGWNGNQDAVLLLVLLVACAVAAEVRSGTVEQARRRQSRRP
jgi:hypothetical protein